MQSELKPCPFCGGEAELSGFQAPEFWVACPKTGCKANTEGFGSKDRAITAWNTRASDAEITRLTEALRAAEDEKKALREALVATEDAIAEYYRYWTGGEMRGSYDGKPERNGLWQALHKARQALAGAKP